MDRPEGIAVGRRGEVYVAMTNNSRRNERDINPANPRPHNAFGHIVRLDIPHADGGFDHASLEHGWSMEVLGEDIREETVACRGRLVQSAPVDALATQAGVPIPAVVGLRCV